MAGEKRQIHKAAIRNFAIEARKILIKSAITEAGFIGISKEEIKKPIQRGMDFEVYETLAGTEKRLFGGDVRRRASLVEAIRQKGFDEVMEETAYTWFNRLIAIRFMEVNNYLPFRMRVLSSDSGSQTPDIVSRSSEVGLNLSEAELAAIQKAKDENQYDEAFRQLFVKTCNELNDILPGLFEKTDDYMELLLKLPYTSDGVVRMLVDTIPENDFNVREGGQVEIIGWLYQYYNTEPKAKAFAKKGKITKEEIPAVTQLFTPDWIVRYMVENSLGRLWIEHLLANGDSRTEQEIANDFEWKYYLPEAEQEPEVQVQLTKIRVERKNLTPEDIMCIDPCQGSGHILVYLYEVLMQIYRKDGYSERDAARSILEHNLFGLDIDDRAYQLSYFSVLMKARQHDRMILKKHIEPHVYSIQESNTVNRAQLKYFGADLSTFERNNATNQLTGLLDTFKDAKEYGSILNVDMYDWDLLRRFVENDRVEGQMGFDAYDIEKTQKRLMTLINIGEIMARKYHVATTNPPYMSISGGGNNKLIEFAKKHYANSKTDLFSIFIEKCINMTVPSCYVAMITMHAWMFLTTYEKLRRLVILNNTIINMAHLGTRAFEEIAGEVVQTTTFVFKKVRFDSYKAKYIRLTEYGSQKSKEEGFLNQQEVYIRSQGIFNKIPGNYLAYWVTERFASIFSFKKVDDYALKICKGGFTGNNDKYLRLWFEVSAEKIGKKWKKYSKGGSFRRWYGNSMHLINWENDGYELKHDSHAGVGASQYYGKEHFVWSGISTGLPSFRYDNSNTYFDDVSPAVVFQHEEKLFLLAVLNSNVTVEILKIIAPTMHFQAGDIKVIPVANGLEEIDDKQIRDNIIIAKEDWDAFETSWDFVRHPLIAVIPRNRLLFEIGRIDLSECYMCWETECNERFIRLQENEEQLNRFFINAYGLEDELSPEVEDKDISVRKANLQREVKSLVSYAVGCMFGRYSLDTEGLAYAGGDWKEAYANKYKVFIPDEDAIIPITDEPYFMDDIVERFVDFIRIVYGEETLEDNLKFIADALGNRGDSPRAVIRNYFLNDFYKDHCNTYSVTGSGKRPIYWLFDSGKQNGFKALIYIHRYTPDTVGLIRSVYLHNAQAAIQNALQNSEYIISTTTSQTERARETKKRDKYMKQLNELRPYYQALSHIALQRITMDLDNGVKKNYQLFQGVEISTEGKKKQTIDLLAKL